MHDSVLVPKKLLFTAPNTPIASPAVLAPAVSDAASTGRCASPSSAGRYGLPSSRGRQTPPPAVCPVVRYGLPLDPEDYYSRFTSSSQVRYGLLGDYSSEDEDEEQESQGQRSLGPITQPAAQIVEMSPVEDMMSRIKLSWQNKAEQYSSERASRLKDAFRAADQELATELGTISLSIQRKQLEFAHADAQQATQQLQARTKKLQELQRSHDKAAAMQQQQVEKLQRQVEAEEAARRREEEDKRRRAEEAAAKASAEEEARRAKEATEAKAKEDAVQQAAEQAKAAVDAKQAAAHAATAADKAAAASKMSAAARCMRCTPEARAFESDIEQKAKLITDDVQQLVDNDAMKKARRDIEKKMTVHVQQISATLDQVAKKCQDVYQLIASQTTPQWRHYAILMFSTKFVRQADLVMLNNKAAFPLATVLVQISSQFPELMDMTLHLMHRECCFSVPCSFAQKDAASGVELTAMQLRRLLGYKEIDDPSKPESKVYESDDDYNKRVEGIMFMYGAIVQVPDPRNPHGLDFGWRWLARFLNTIPASRAAGKALISFVKAAGYSMFGRFRGQFIKLLKCMHDDFLPELAQSQEADVQSVRVMLEHYLTQGQYKKEPEGAAMPKIDISSLTRA